MKFVGVLVMLLAAAPAFAQEGVAEKGEPERSYFTVALAAGGLVPVSELQGNRGTQAGLDVWTRIGWTSSMGLGLVVNLEYAPIRHDTTSDRSIEAHLFTATAAPRFTLGKKAVRVWLSAGGGILIERVRTDNHTTAEVVTQTESVFTLTGMGGLDLHLFGNGGFTLAGGYTRTLSDASSYDYFSVNAGLVFTI